MAKAVLGYSSGPNQRMAAEVHRLRQRVCDLEARVTRLQEERAARAGSGRNPVLDIEMGLFGIARTWNLRRPRGHGPRAAGR